MSRDVMRQDRLPVANDQGVLHLHISDKMPEAQELKEHVEGMTSKNTDHKAEPVFNPSVSSAQRQMMAIAEHHPEKLYKRNRGALSMSKSQLHDFASTKGLKK